MYDSKLAIKLKEIIESKFSNVEIAKRFLSRLEQGVLTKDENPVSHFCAYFAAYDPKAKEIFIGHHKKSGLWLVNGGHIDKDETLQETLKREIDEEWGLDYGSLDVGEPQLLTITDIYNPEKQPCRAHYDVWHFVKVDKNTFNPDKDKLAEEFYENRWANLEGARKLVAKDVNHNIAMDFIENNLFNE
jgi:8-oxo-dGTP pyrophosphatase MutT (NUDIX family)